MVNSLSVEVVLKENWPKICSEVDNWARLASNQFTSSLFVNKEDKIFLSSCTIATCIFEELTKEYTREWDTVLVCRDSVHSIQAVALIHKVTNQLIYLMTHPNNLRHANNKNLENRVQGAGTAIIFYLAQLALNTPIPIQAINVKKNAVPFYEKLGFETDVSNEKSGARNMKLSFEKIKELSSRISKEL